MKKKITPIGDIVKNVFSRLESQSNVSEEKINSIWAATVGAEAAKHSKPIALKKKILMIYVDSSSWLQELTLRKRPALKALKKSLGRDRISEIHFKIGE